MCYYFARNHGGDYLSARRRWLVLQDQIININDAGTNIVLSTSHDPPEPARDDEGGIRAVTVKQCACSPTNHPGSFRDLINKIWISLLELQNLQKIRAVAKQSL
ncbi:hypothetical protein ACFE04_018563 [Oxalis oulophora]